MTNEVYFFCSSVPYIFFLPIFFFFAPSFPPFLSSSFFIYPNSCLHSASANLLILCIPFAQLVFAICLHILLDDKSTPRIDSHLIGTSASLQRIDSHLIVVPQTVHLIQDADNKTSQHRCVPVIKADHLALETTHSNTKHDLLMVHFLSLNRRAYNLLRVSVIHTTIRIVTIFYFCDNDIWTKLTPTQVLLCVGLGCALVCSSLQRVIQIVSGYEYRSTRLHVFHWKEKYSVSLCILFSPFLYGQLLLVSSLSDTVPLGQWVHIVGVTKKTLHLIPMVAFGTFRKRICSCALSVRSS